MIFVKKNDEFKRVMHVVVVLLTCKTCKYAGFS